MPDLPMSDRPVSQEKCCNVKQVEPGVSVTVDSVAAVAPDKVVVVSRRAVLNDFGAPICPPNPVSPISPERCSR